jgi:hypothetical protein
VDSPRRSTPAWIAYSFGKPVRIDRYAINYVNGSITTRAPKNWTLQGFNGSYWSIVDTGPMKVNWAGSQTRSYDVQTAGAYSSYKLVVTDDNDTRAGVVVISMGNLSLQSCQVNIEGNWQEDSTRSTADSGYFVPLSVDLGPARWRQVYKFYVGGSADILRPAPNDAHYFVPGTWTLQGNVLTLTYTDHKWNTTSGTFVDTFEVLEADANHLKLKRN